MCGIVGVVGTGDVAGRLLAGLRRLEYRGYDSAGIATVVDGSLERRRAKGKIGELETLLSRAPLGGEIGIGHTRWATHGVPNEINAHPHATTKVAAVHNGIIENFAELRDELVGAGRNFESETDTEAVVHLISSYLDQGDSPQTAVARSLKRLEGAFSLAIVFAGELNLMIGARRGSPLAVGWGDDEMFLGSDAIALASETNRISYLEDGDWVELTRTNAVFHDAEDQVVEREVRSSAASGALIGKGNYRHFMEKEIYEQPTVIGETLNGYFNPADRTIQLPDLGVKLEGVSKVTIVACGTSYLAALVGKFWIERYARVSAEVDIASEFRYRRAPMPPGGLALFISQSGETADTLAALRFAAGEGQHTVSLVNVSESTMARESDAILMTNAGPEIGVASTKAFTCQLVALAAFAISLARAKGAITTADEARLSHAIAEVPARAVDVLNHDAAIKTLAESLVHAGSILYIGRGTSYPIALEGALKLKEISYIHAEGFAAGELKHGPIALIDEGVPVVVIAPSDDLFDKTMSNLREVAARGGRVILITDEAGRRKVGDEPWETIVMPDVDPFVTPILYTIPVQLLAYHVAVLKGTDVDQPRNLAKSVTVE
ncbi:MAG: glutamine--fructose-6-phosphate transaminase (isomerizing) [Proteobacteria bacterium]|nr:glutamine--fructose-6-phosphate transaminase (isomerizing) [Pseudomonadota bacterium]MDA1057153.1 glutamine--fructose-6-phosphate transaminase (isomerizing) [Pseudomonadota bacterium]